MAETVIKVDGLGKKYRIGLKEKMSNSLAETITRTLTAPFRSFKRLRSLSSFDGKEGDDVFWALQNISFDVKKGQVLGVIGKNGAGKSTLLKLLSRITAPSSGSIEITGRVASLLEVGTGFHPELSGRENVYLNGTILGMTRAEVGEKFDEILEFSGVEKFIDTPVKRYSSGMRVRLAFAVAAHLEPEILIVDEVLAVGDYEFQKKCLGKMQDVSGEGRTVLFVSHNMVAVENLCDSAIVLEKGKMVYEGPTHQAIQKYMQVENVGQGISLKEHDNREGNGDLRYSRVYLSDDEGRVINTAISGRALNINLEIDSSEKAVVGTEVYCAMGIFDSSGNRLCSLSSIAIDETLQVSSQQNILTWTLDRLSLANGEYRCTIFMSYDEKGMDPIDWVKDAFTFNVERGDYFGTGKQLVSQNDTFFVDHKVKLQKAL